jgi:hypothetical protein
MHFYAYFALYLVPQSNVVVCSILHNLLRYKTPIKMIEVNLNFKKFL